MSSRSIDPLTPAAVAENGPTVTGVRLPSQMRAELQREATGNNRSLSQEIIQRLAATLSAKKQARSLQPSTYLKVHDYGTDVAPMTDLERALLAHFNAMPPEKQLALLTFIKK